MTKLKIATAIGVAAGMLLPLASFAATATNIEFSNGDVTIAGTGGSSTNAIFRVVVPANQVVEYFETDVLGDNLAPVCTSVGGELGLQEGTHEVTLPVKFPPNTGTYTVQGKGAGIYGGFRSVDCNDNVVLPATPFAGALRTVANASSGGGLGGSVPSYFETLMAQLAALIAKLTAATTPTPTPTPSATPTPAPTPVKPPCPPMYTGYNRVEVQTWLLNNGYAAGFHAKGVYSATQPGVVWGQTSITAYNAAIEACH